MTAIGYTSGDPRKVDVAGDTMTGDLVLPGDPNAALKAATKQYVDNQVSAASGTYVDTTGDTMTGSLILSGGSTNLTVGGSASVTGNVSISGDVVSPVEVNATLSASTLPLGPSGAVHTGINIASSYVGGDDNGSGTDSTGRINLYSYQRANVKAFGENIRNFAMRSDAKTMQAFYMPVDATKKGGYDPTSRDPKTSGVSWKPVVWQGAHYEANDHGSIHGHWELEIADSTGALQGRLEIPFIDQATDGAAALDQATIGVDYTNIRTNLADFSVRAQNIASGPYSGQNTGLRIGGNNSVNKDVMLSISSDMATSGRRWVVRANTTTEAGANAGTDFQILNYDDTGTLIGTSIGIERATGNVTIGAAPPGALGKLHISPPTNKHGIIVKPSASQGANAAYAAQLTATTDRLLDVRVTGDSLARLVQYTDGKIEWGSGATSRDTNLYRSAADTLKTDDAFVAAGSITGQSGAAITGNLTVSGSGTFSNMSVSASAATGHVVHIGNTATTPADFTLHVETANSGERAIAVAVAGDSNHRWGVRSNGTMNWGTGSDSPDTNLYRSYAHVLATDDSLHVAGHALGTPQAADQGFIAWNGDPVNANNATAGASGTVYLMQVPVTKSATTASIWFIVGGTAAAGVTTAEIGLYNSSGTKLGSADISTLITTSNVLRSASVAVAVTPGLYWVAIVINATTMPSLCRPNAVTAAQLNANLTASTARYAVNGTGQATLPASITPSSNDTSGSIRAWWTAVA